MVQKIIAEPRKPGAPEEKQCGMRANTVAFPQAKMKELVTARLPPTSEEAVPYLADTLSIALVGADPDVFLCAEQAFLCVSARAAKAGGVAGWKGVVCRGFGSCAMGRNSAGCIHGCR